MKKIFILIFIILGAIKGYSQNNIQYEYDEVQRLSKATYSNGVVVQYSYDELGNRMSKVVSNNCQTATASIVGTQTILIGQSANLTVVLQGQMPYTFVFNGQTYSNINSNTYTINVSPTQTNTYTLASISNGCGTGTVGGQAVVTVIVPCTTVAPPVLSASPLNATPNQSCTLGASGCLGTINWYNQVNGGTLLGTGTSLSVPSIAQTTTYFASCSYNGCESNRANATIKVDNTCNFSIYANILPGGCGQNNSTVYISGSGSGTYNYSWNDGNTSNYRTDLSSGSYFVNISDANGCFKQQVINVDASGNAFWDGETTGLNAVNMGSRSAIANGHLIFQDASNLGVVKDLNISNGQINTINLSAGFTPTGYWFINSNQNGAATADDKVLFQPFISSTIYKLVATNYLAQNFGTVNVGNTFPWTSAISNTTGDKIFALYESGGNGTIKSYDVSGNQQATYTLPSTSIVYYKSALQAENGKLFAFNGSKVYVFDESLNLIRTIDTYFGINNISIKGGKIYVANVQSRFEIWDSNTGTRLKTMFLSGISGSDAKIGLSDQYAFVPVNTNYVDVFDLITFTKMQTLDAGGFVGGLHYDPISGKAVALMGDKVRYIKAVKDILSVFGTVTNTTNGNSTGAITLNVIGGNASYSWSNGMTSKDISNLSAGIHTVTITPIDGSCPLKRIFQVNTSTLPSAPTISSNKSSICKGESITLTATNCSGTITWNNNFGSGTTINVAPLTNTQYAATCTVGGLASNNSNILSITVNDNPTTPSVSSTQIITGQIATLVASNCTGTVTWYDATANGNQLGTGVSYNTPTLTTTTTYYASCSVNSCVSTNKGSGTVTVTACNVSAPTAINASNCGTGSVVLSASGCSNGTYHWYPTASGGVSIGASVSYTTPSISTTTNYYVDCTVGSCISNRTTVTATINAIPSAPTISSVTIDSGQSIILTATNCTGNITWYDAVSGGALLGYGSSYSTQTLVTSTNFYASCTVNNCVSTRGTGTVTVNICNVTAPSTTPANRCGTETVTLSASGCNGTYNWYAASFGGTSLSATSSFTTSSISTTTNYYVDCTIGTCTSSRTVATATISPVPSTPTVSSTTITSGQTTTLTTTNCTGTTTWFNVATGGTSLATGNSYTTSALTATTTYYSECSINGCVSTRGSVTINSPCQNIINHSGTIIAGTYSSATTIISTGNISSGTFYQAGQSITMLPGFSVSSHETFTTKIESCTPTIPTNGLIAYYPFNGNANDESGNNNNGTVNGASLTLDRFGVTNKAYNFNDGNYILVPNSSTLILPNAFTLSVWVNMKSAIGRDGWGNLFTYGYHSILTKNCDRGQLQAAIAPQSDGSFILTTWVGNSGNQPNITFQLNQWQHIAVVYDGSTLKQFVNGTLIASQTLTMDLTSTNSSNLFIGKMGCWSYFFNGFLDDIRIYNRGLSVNEIGQIYNSEKP